MEHRRSRDYETGAMAFGRRMQLTPHRPVRGSGKINAPTSLFLSVRLLPEALLAAP